MDRIELPMYAGDLAGTFDPGPYATASGCPRKYGVVARIRLLDEQYFWIDLFKHGKKVWDCNPTFFMSHFRPVQP